MLEYSSMIEGLTFVCVEQDRGSIIIPWLSAMFPSADGRNESRRQLAALTNSFIIYVYSIGVMIISMCALEKRLSLTFQRISVYTVHAFREISGKLQTAIFSKVRCGTP